MTTAVSTAVPTSITAGGYDGEMGSLYALESQHRDGDMQAGKMQVQGEEKAEQKAIQDDQQAIEREEEAGSHHGFWSDIENALGDVAEVAGAVGAAATTVGTAGVGAAVLAPIAAAATTTAGASELAGAGAHVVSSHYAADAERAAADAEDGTLRAGRMQDAANATIDVMREADESSRQTEQTIQGTIQTNDRTSVDTAASLHIRG